jgi:hypothetical protein
MHTPGCLKGRSFPSVMLPRNGEQIGEAIQPATGQPIRAIVAMKVGQVLTAAFLYTDAEEADRGCGVFLAFANQKASKAIAALVVAGQASPMAVLDTGVIAVPLPDDRTFVSIPVQDDCDVWMVPTGDLGASWAVSAWLEEQQALAPTAQKG